MTQNISWQKQALCKDMPTENFFEEYEKDEVVREQIKAVCNSCWVRFHCLLYARETQSYGVWGGHYMIDGKIVGDEEAVRQYELQRETS